MNITLLKSALLHKQMIAALAILNASCLALGFTLYSFAQLFFSQGPLPPQLLGQPPMHGILPGLVSGIILSILLVSAELRDFINHTPHHYKRGKDNMGKTMLLFTVLVFVAMGCEAQVKVGMKRDGKTGLSTSYARLEPWSVYMMMNNEILNHHDIPLGEHFEIVNEQVQGLVEKDGKVSVGCKLLISDANGNTIFEVADLYEGKDVYDKNDISNLCCTVQIAESLGWEEKYTVTANFWDKYGTGKLINRVTIRTIDIP